jgi:hypothetical protein
MFTIKTQASVATANQQIREHRARISSGSISSTTNINTSSKSLDTVNNIAGRLLHTTTRQQRGRTLYPAQN